MLSDFDVTKNIQVVNYMLRLNSGRINYTKLIKLLYIADKTFLKEYDTTITGDKYASMKNGPVLSYLYYLICGSFEKSVQTLWNSKFNTDKYDITPVGDIDQDLGELTPAEIEMLEAIDTKYKNHSYNDMIEITHKKKDFPEVEWEIAEKQKTSLHLDIEKILTAVGKKKDHIDYILKESEAYKIEQKFFQSL